jgi:hypothetical protein
MATVRLEHLRPATAILNAEDRFARDSGFFGRHPRPFGGVKYHLVGHMQGGARVDYAAPRELVVVDTPSGYAVFFGLLREADGSVRRFEPEDGTYVIKVDAQFYQPSEHLIHLPEPAAAQSIDLEPGYAYPFPDASLRNGGAPALLRGTVHEAGGAGVAGVAVEIVGQSNICLTDDGGQWVLVLREGWPGGDVTVRFSRPGGAVEEVASVPVSRGGGSALRQAGLRGWVRSAAGVPIAGARIEVGGHPGSAVPAQDGSWCFYFGLNQPDEVVSVSASLPDGRRQTQSNVLVKQRAVVVVPSFKIA